METDIIIVGGGVIGSAIAWELSHYNLDIVLLEKEDDVAMGTSKANSGIVHAGYNANYKTLKGMLNAKANPLFDKICKDLQVPFKRIGSLVVGFDEKDLKILKTEKENGEKLGIKGLEIIKKDRLHSLEPNLNPKAQYALYAPTAGIISPYELTIAFADSAVINGAKILLETEVFGVIREGEEIKGVRTTKGDLRGKVVINAAGVFADRLAGLAGDDSIEIIPRKGEYHLLDKNWGTMVKHVLFPVPTEFSKGVLVTPTAHGNLLLGPNSYPIEEKNNRATTSMGLEEVYAETKKLVPNLNRKDVISSFAGLRAAADGDDFIIGPADNVRGLINVAGIQSPGLSSAPAIAEMVAELVKDMLKESNPEFRVVYKEDFQAELPEPAVLADNFQLAKLERWQKIVEENPDFGEVICRCEKVTKGEIIWAVHRPVPARSIDAVKRRTRAGAGRCQGGFCGPKVLEILAQELNISPLQVTKKGKGSELLIAKAKELINKEPEGRCS